MLPLKILRIFDYQQPRVESKPIDQLPSNEVNSLKNHAFASTEERRNIQDRRSNERREKQDATLLNTRRPQGRRRSLGRRETDISEEITYRPISIKG
ncbi:MAG: hypothetical protein K2P84_12705 [Undibacterium sp.]|nr:hypothetical protein [Undibacterium sp.]